MALSFGLSNTKQTTGDSPADGQVAGACAVGGEAEGPWLFQPGGDKASGGTLTARPTSSY